MEFIELSLAGVFRLEPKVFTDGRGFFLESYRRDRFETAGFPPFVQDNHSRSAKGVLRGLHFQTPPHAQGKLVRCVRGAVFDVGVDIRPGSPTFGRWAGERLDADNKRMLYFPPGFAHGFLALEDGSEVLYKTTAYYARDHDRGLSWDDPDIGIAWPDPGAPLQLSDKDRRWPGLRTLRA